MLIDFTGNHFDWSKKKQIDRYKQHYQLLKQNTDSIMNIDGKKARVIVTVFINWYHRIQFGISETFKLFEILLKTFSD